MPEGDDMGRFIPGHLLNTSEAAFARGDNMVQFHTGADQWPPATALAEAQAMDDQALAVVIMEGELSAGSLAVFLQDGSRRGAVEVGIPPAVVGKVARTDAALIEFSKRLLEKNGFEIAPSATPEAAGASAKEGGDGK